MHQLKKFLFFTLFFYDSTNASFEKRELRTPVLNLMSIVSEKPSSNSAGDPFSFTTPNSTEDCIKIDFYFTRSTLSTNSCLLSSICTNISVGLPSSGLSATGTVRLVGCLTASKINKTFYVNQQSLSAVLNKMSLLNSLSCANPSGLGLLPVCARMRDADNSSMMSSPWVNAGIECDGDSKCWQVNSETRAYTPPLEVHTPEGGSGTCTTYTDCDS